MPFPREKKLLRSSVQTADFTLLNMLNDRL